MKPMHFGLPQASGPICATQAAEPVLEAMGRHAPQGPVELAEHEGQVSCEACRLVLAQRLTADVAVELIRPMLEPDRQRLEAIRVQRRDDPRPESATRETLAMSRMQRRFNCLMKQLRERPVLA